MKFQIHQLELEGTSREIRLQAGMNLITGPVGTGKTTALSLLASLVGAKLGKVPEEVKRHVSGIRGKLAIGDQEFVVRRDLAASDAALIDIVGGDQATRLRLAGSVGPNDTTYVNWLLSIADIPQLRVRSAPTKEDSDFQPLSFRDYLLYCILRQSSLDNGIFGSNDAFKDIKRKYVFEVLAGWRGEEQAALEAELRDVVDELRLLTENHAGLRRALDSLAGDELQNITERKQALVDRLSKLTDASASSIRESKPEVRRLQRTILDLDEEIAKVNRELDNIGNAQRRLRTLEGQLRTQQSRLIRAVVAKKSFAGFEFVQCPRCSSKVEATRADENTCYLCLQPDGHLQEDVGFSAEIDRLEAQISETRHLVDEQEQAQASALEKLPQLMGKRGQLGNELNHAMSSYVSDNEEAIRARAAEEAELQAGLKHLGQMGSWINRFEAIDTQRTTLEARKAELQEELAEIREAARKSEDVIREIEAEFTRMIDALHVPKPALPQETKIDRVRFMPHPYGQSFEQLSQGTHVMVQVALAIAMHRVALNRAIPLPGLLAIDGLSDNIGKQGLDQERVNAMYHELERLALEAAGRIQIIVVDHEGIAPPNIATKYTRLALSDTDKLVPIPSGE